MNSKPNDEPHEAEQWITITTAAKHLGISRDAIYCAIKRGDIRSKPMLDKIAVFQPDVNAYIPRAYAGRRPNRRPAGVKGPGGRPSPRKQESANPSPLR